MFCYNFFDSEAKLLYQGLPPISDFFNVLEDKDLSEDDYKHALQVFDLFNCKTLKDYLCLYLSSDVLLLADIFEHFRNILFDGFGLDPIHFA